MLSPEPISGACLNSTNRYVALDVETTGLSPQNGDRVIEIGAVAIEDQSIVAEFSSLVDVGKMIPWQVQQMHGIMMDKNINFVSYSNIIQHSLDRISYQCYGNIK